MKRVKLLLFVVLLGLATSCINQKGGFYYPANVVLDKENFTTRGRYYGKSQQSIVFGLNMDKNGMYHIAYINLKEKAELKPNEIFTNITIDVDNQMVFFGILITKTVIIGADVIKFKE